MTKTNKLVQAMRDALGLNPEIVAEYKILTADGTELIFPATDEEPVVGDVVASNIKDGDYLMPNEDVWVIKEGKLEEIIKKEEEIPTEEVEAEVEETLTETEEEEIDEIAKMLKSLKEQADKQAEEIKKLKEEVNKLKGIEDEIVALRKESTEEVEEKILALKKQIGTREIGEIENRPKSWINARINR